MSGPEIDHASPPKRSRLVPPTCRWLRRPLGMLSLLLVVIGTGVYVTARDHWIATSLLFYALPPIVIALLGSLSLIAFWRDLTSRTARIVAIAAALLLIGWSQFHSWRIDPVPGAAEDDIHIAFWNTSHLAAGSVRIARAVGRMDADIIALCEAGPATEEQRAIWQAACPDYDITFLGSEMLVLTRGVSGAATSYSLSNHTEVRQLDIQLPEGMVSCLLVDVASSPLFPRRQALRELAAIADSLADRPLLILGDFNTPADSVLFRPLSKRHTNAFRHAGVGFSPTWPVPLPMLDLDQIWVNRFVDVRVCRLGWRWISDHRPVYASVRLRTWPGSSEK